MRRLDGIFTEVRDRLARAEREQRKACEALESLVGKGIVQGHEVKLVWDDRETFARIAINMDDRHEGKIICENGRYRVLGGEKPDDERGAETITELDAAIADVLEAIVVRWKRDAERAPQIMILGGRS